MIKFQSVMLTVTHDQTSGVTVVEIKVATFTGT
jgi:hypothetical protein